MSNVGIGVFGPFYGLRVALLSTYALGGQVDKLRD
jgi:hypothetical protein